MPDDAVRRFVALDYFESSRGRIWTGPSPFTWRKDDGLSAWSGQWTIEHPEVDPATRFEVVGVEAYCIHVIREGVPVGLLVRKSAP